MSGDQLLDGATVQPQHLFGLVAGKGSDGAAHALSMDANGKLNTNVSGIVTGGITAAAGDNIEIMGRDSGSVLRTVKTLSDGSVVVSGTFFPATPTVVQYGQKTVGVTNTAVQLTTQAVSQAVVQALAANAGNVVIGDSAVTTANGFQLQPGQATGIALDNMNRLYVNGTANDGVCWIGS